MNSYAILLTCFNRKETTLRCLSRLFELIDNVDVYLVDDNSSDGTFEAVAIQFPQVNIIKGNGNLFWNRGMHLAWEHASKKDYEYYLWLNDDVILYPNCFQELYDCANDTKNEAIIVGIIETVEKDKTLYGGTDKNKKLIQSNGKLNPITNMNGNVVLISKYVFKILGNLDPTYHHDLGDVDYGLRAQKNGIKVYTTRIPVGRGDLNNLCRERIKNTTLRKRFIKLYSPLGSNPNINFYFRKRHSGVFNAISYFLFQHLLNILPDSIVNVIFGKKYN